MTIVDNHRASCSLQHDAFIYDSDDGYLASLAPLLEEADAARDVLLAVVPTRNAALLRSAVGGALGGIEFIAAETWYRHPVSTIASYDAILRELPEGARAFVIGEVQFGDTETDRAAWTRYEAALNRALSHHNVRVICPYDARALPTTVIDNARRTHPYLVTDTHVDPSEHYLDPEIVFSLLPPTTAVPTSRPHVELLVDGDLRTARRAFAAAAAEKGLDAERVDELTLAVNEVLTNALLHGGGFARLRIWSALGEDLTCVVDDSGTGIDDPLLGYAGPPPASAGGYGVWLARRLFDRSELLRGETDGLTVVLTTRR